MWFYETMVWYLKNECDRWREWEGGGCKWYYQKGCDALNKECDCNTVKYGCGDVKGGVI